MVEQHFVQRTVEGRQRIGQQLIRVIVADFHGNQRVAAQQGHVFRRIAGFPIDIDDHLPFRIQHPGDVRPRRADLRRCDCLVRLATGAQQHARLACPNDQRETVLLGAAHQDGSVRRVRLDPSGNGQRRTSGIQAGRFLEEDGGRSS